MTGNLIPAIAGVVFLIVGAFLTFKPNVTYKKDSIADVWAIAGIIFLILGVVLLLSPLLQ